MEQNIEHGELEALVLEVGGMISKLGLIEGITEEVHSSNTDDSAKQYTNSFTAVMGHEFRMILEDTSGDVV